MNLMRIVNYCILAAETELDTEGGRDSSKFEYVWRCVSVGSGRKDIATRLIKGVLNDLKVRIRNTVT